MSIVSISLVDVQVCACRAHCKVMYIADAACMLVSLLYFLGWDCVGHHFSCD